MIYKNLFNEYRDYVGIVDSDVFQYIKNNNIDETEGMHVWFGLVATPFLISAIKENKIDFVVKSFMFIEECLKTNDKDITEVIEFSFLEGVISELGDDIEKVKIYFDEETVKSYNNIKEYIL